MATISMELRGLRDLKLALDAKAEQYASGMQAGLGKAGLYLLRESQRLVPIQTGNLRGSGFVRRQPGTSGLQTVVLVGYTAEYAIYVHENLDAYHGRLFNMAYEDEIEEHGPNHPYWFKRGARQQAKFLERPFREKQKKLKAIVLDSMQ